MAYIAGFFLILYLLLAGAYFFLLKPRPLILPEELEPDIEDEEED